MNYRISVQQWTASSGKFAEIERVQLACIDINLEYDVLNHMLAHVVATKQVLANDNELIFSMYVHGTAVSIVQSKRVKM